LGADDDGLDETALTALAAQSDLAAQVKPTVPKDWQLYWNLVSPDSIRLPPARLRFVA
jgi:hypothetical protein